MSAVVRLSLDELDRLCAILSAELRLTLVPGDSWAWNRAARKLLYPRDRLTAMEPAAATGYLWRTVQHALSSHGQLDAYDVAVDAVLASEAQTGERAMHPHWVMGLMFAAERERVEAIARGGAHNLANSFLPRRGTGYRTQQATQDRDIINAASSSAAQYWQRVATALGAIAAGSLDPRDLPADIAWDEPIVTGVRALPKAPTYDALLEQVEVLVPLLVRKQLESLAAPGESAEEPAGEQASQNPAGSGSATKPTSGDNQQSGAGESVEPEDEEPEHEHADHADVGESEDKAAPADHTDEEPANSEISAEQLAALGDEVDATSDERVAIDYFEDNATANPKEAEHSSPAGGWGNNGQRLFDEKRGPAWNAVSRTNAHVIAPIRRTLLQYLAENDVGEVEHGTRTGRLDYRYATKPAHLLTQPPFCQRTQTDERSYAVGLIIDRSGSMCGRCDARPFHEAFGDGQTLRWHLAARMAVALSEALARVPGAQTAIVAYDGRVDVVKHLGEALGPSVRQRVMDHMVARGDNDDVGALKAMADELRSSAAHAKLIFHLTDGQFCSEAGEVKRTVRELSAANIELVVLTLGLKADFARKFVPIAMADEVCDATVARVLARHLDRMLGTVRRGRPWPVVDDIATNLVKIFPRV